MGNSEYGSVVVVSLDVGCVVDVVVGGVVAHLGVVYLRLASAYQSRWSPCNVQWETPSMVMVW